MLTLWEIRTSGFDLRHWKAMVRSSVSRAVKVCLAVAILAGGGGDAVVVVGECLGGVLVSRFGITEEW